MDSTWGGKGEGTPATFWIGMEFTSSIHVQCVSFLDLASYGVTGVEVQVLTANGNDWVSVIRVEDLVPGVRHNIPVSGNPTDSPSSTPVTIPSNTLTMVPSSIPTWVMTSSPVNSPFSNRYYESWRIWATGDMIVK